MNIEEKIKKKRELYVLKFGKEPTSVILGYWHEAELVKKGIIKEKTTGHFLWGMRVIIDNNNPTKTEMGDYRL